MVETQDGGTVIGSDTIIKGEMMVESKAKILGRFEGTIEAKGQIEVADKAICHADVAAKVVQIDGGMQGNITAVDRVQLNATANLKGDITSSKLVVEKGACLDGHFKIGPEVMKRDGGAGSQPPRAAKPPMGQTPPGDKHGKEMHGGQGG